MPFRRADKPAAGGDRRQAKAHGLGNRCLRQFSIDDGLENSMPLISSTRAKWARGSYQVITRRWGSVMVILWKRQLTRHSIES